MGDAILFVSPHRSDAQWLGEALATTELRLEHAGNLREAGEKLKLGYFGAVLTEAELPDGSWTGVVDLTSELVAFPAVVVTHRLADDRFWAEVLSYGAYDLLAQPFDAGEVRRILANACQQRANKPVCPQPGRSQSAAMAL